MEERLIDKDDERLIRLKKKADEVDAEDATLPEGEEPPAEEEVLVTLPEDEEEYDEDLVGLTPSELAREKARRQRAEEEARAECANLASLAEEELAGGAFDKAEAFFAQAASYGFEEERVAKGLWTARTKNFTTTEPFYNEEYAVEFSYCDDESKKFVREKVEKTLLKEREEIEKEEKELAPEVLAKQEERRQAFADNRKYYAVRLLAFLAVLALFAIATIVSSSYIVRTLSSVPVILTGVFGGLTLIAFVIALVFFLKFMGANKLCRRNEQLSSTEDGARLESLRNKLDCLKRILEDEE
ncbi:MAG: hypothetical protein HDP28_01390 [Clostridia bacterium]|nr:hypothetical protein [Clostridia bacterium]